MQHHQDGVGHGPLRRLTLAGVGRGCDAVRMRRALPALLLPILAGADPAAAAERAIAIPSFDRIRIDGPFDVRLTTRATPGVTVSGDPRMLESVAVRVEGGTLIVRAGNAGWGERPRARGLPNPIVTVRTRDLRGAGVAGGGTLRITGPVTASRVDLSITGSGTLDAPALAAGDLVMTLIGDGQATLAGTARTARLLGNGSGRIAAAGLTAGDAVVRTEGAVAVTVTARYTATANSTGLGAIDILGKPDCKVKPQADGPIRCFNAPVAGK